MSDEKVPGFTKDGLPDGRGLSEGSKANQFRKGDERQRPGRPKGLRDRKKIIESIRDLTVDANLNGRKRKIGTDTGILLAARAKALKGDPRAIEFLNGLFERIEPLLVEPEQTEKLLREDQEILAAAFARNLAHGGWNDAGETGNVDG